MLKQFLKFQLKIAFPDFRSYLPPFFDDWLIPGIPIKSRCVYSYIRYKYLKEYIIFLLGFGNSRRDHIPHIIKRKIIRYYSNKYNMRTFVETGTYLGDMISALSRAFDEIHSIELFRPLYEKARLRFATIKNIHLTFGDSSTELANILENLDHPALFWLDAHYSGEGTARGHDDSPILNEINRIFECGMMNHVILIDDASLFNGAYGYPEIDAFKKCVLKKRPNYHFEVSDNIIILEPTEQS